MQRPENCVKVILGLVIISVLGINWAIVSTRNQDTSAAVRPVDDIQFELKSQLHDILREISELKNLEGTQKSEIAIPVVSPTRNSTQTLIPLGERCEMVKLPVSTVNTTPVECSECMNSVPKQNFSGRDQFTRDIRTKFVQEGVSSVGGWMQSEVGLITAYLSRLQHNLNIFGNVGEIGVHHGLYFITIAHTAAEGERLFVCDVFSKQHLNIDASGKGDKEKFFENLKRFGVAPDSLVVFEGSSLELRDVFMCNNNLSKFRLFSVDGGHTLELTENDLQVADCIVGEGGIVSLDDWCNRSWKGVMAGMQHWYHTKKTRLVPFLFMGAKAFFTTKSHFQYYKDAILQHNVLSQYVISAEYRGLSVLLGKEAMEWKLVKESWIEAINSL